VHRSSVIIEEVKDGEHDVAQITTTTAAKVSQAQQSPSFTAVEIILYDQAVMHLMCC